MHGRDAAAQPRLDALSLDILDGSVVVPARGAGIIARARAYVGPAMLVGVGYMDPGNWGTDLAAGAGHRYALLWVLVLASAMAVVLQVLAARLGLATGRDLAQACHNYYPAWTRIPNWLLGEVAIAACDLAELLGSAIALNLLFGIPMLWAVLVTGADVLLLLGFQRVGMRGIEAVVAVLVATIAACFMIELFVLPGTRPDLATIGAALTSPGLHGAAQATIAVGIIGATVMPHNLYLHSALVRSRRIPEEPDARGSAIRWNVVDTVAALSFAFLVNAAILLLAAAVFHGRDAAVVDGVRIALGPDSDWIRVAYLTLAPLIGIGVASTLFGVALLASGQASTITATIAGQVVMEGFLNLRLTPWKRRLATRLAALVPAIAVVGLRGADNLNDLLVVSQVVLAFQLPFAMLPLLHFTSSRRIMRGVASGPLLLAAGWGSAAVIIGFDLYGLPGIVADIAHILGA
ncbi:Nramp family divalent metal transporter [Sphingomonas sp.]|uniref:Nramp family divalent metal transporter n=1 Tax=Sphingomonas sp. TaxID=28214 RepID=UPI003B00A556